VSRADAPLNAQLEELEAWLRGLPAAAGARQWSRVLLAEGGLVNWQPDGGKLPQLRRDALRSPQQFEPRWTELVEQGRGSWINLSAWGVWEDALVVLAETPTSGESGRFAPPEISVNFSGPSGSSWRLDGRLEIIEA